MSYTVSPTATTTNNASASTSTGTSGLTKDAASITGNYSTFLSLLTAQIKNQDPLSPMDTTQWTNQLVQYSSVEQQLKGNTYLESLVNANAAGNMNAAVSYIGKTVTADQTTANLSGGKATWNYNLGATADKTTMTVVDADGKTVYAAAGTDNDKGAHTFTWDGKDSTGKTLADGTYTLKVTGTTAGGSNIATEVGISGVVTSATNNAGVITLKVGTSDVPLSSVTSVS